MASTITGTLFNWSITSPGGEVCGAAKNEAQATLDPDGTVVIKSGDAVLWAGHIMSLVGLVGATPALLFADLLNNYLTGSSSQYSLAAARFGVDSSSNPGPTIGGLLFDPTTTTGGNWTIPLTATPTALGIGDNYEDDADDYFTLTSPTQLTINVTGKYHLSAGFFILSNDTLAPMVVQVLLNGQNIFAAPPGVNSFGPGSTTGTSPISALYSRGYACNGSMDCNLTAGDILTCKLYAEGGSGGDTAEISPTSALCIHLIGGTSSGAGSSGVTAVLNATDSGEALVTGAAPIYSVKRLKAGNGIAVSSDATSVTVTATGNGAQRFTFNGAQPTWTTGDPDLIIPFDTLQYTTGSVVAVLTSPGVVTIQEAGMYLVTANVTAVRTAGATVTDMVPVIIARNGVQDGGRFRATTNNSERFTLFGTNTLQCAVGDTISFILPNYTAPPATTYEILNSTNSLGCALSVIKL